MLNSYKGWKLHTFMNGFNGGYLVYWYEPSFFEKLIGFSKQNSEIVQKIYIKYKIIPSRGEVKNYIDSLSQKAITNSIASINH